MFCPMMPGPVAVSTNKKSHYLIQVNDRGVMFLYYYIKIMTMRG